MHAAGRKDVPKQLLEATLIKLEERARAGNLVELREGESPSDVEWLSPLLRTALHDGNARFCIDALDDFFGDEFFHVADAKLFPIYLKRARLEWEEMASSILFEELFKALWYEAIGIALRKHQSSPSFIERDIEIGKRLKKIRSLDGGIC